MTYTSYTTSFFCTAHFLPSMTTVCKWPSVGCGSSFSFFGLNGSSKERDDSEWIQLYNPPTTQTGPRPIICLNFTELGSNWNSLPEIKSAQSSLIWPNTAYYYSYAYIYKKKTYHVSHHISGCLIPKQFVVFLGDTDTSPPTIDSNHVSPPSSGMVVCHEKNGFSTQLLWNGRVVI